MNPISKALWLLNRPQQALFQGSKALSDTNASTMTAMGNAGYGVPAQVGMGLAASLPAFVGGAYEGLTGGGDDVTGEDLTGNKALGTFLDLTADPTSLLGTGALKAPQAARTLKNLQTLKGTPLESMGNRLGALTKLRMDVPMPFKEGNPFYMLGDQLGGLPEGLRRALHGNSSISRLSPGISGEFIRGPKGADVILSTRGTAKKALPHETFHREFARSPKITAREASDYYDWAKKADPEGFKKIARSYGDIAERKMPFADEYGAWATEGAGKLAPKGMFPNIAKAQTSATDIPAEAFKQAFGANMMVPFHAMDYGRRGWNVSRNKKRKEVD